VLFFIENSVRGCYVVANSGQRQRRHTEWNCSIYVQSQVPNSVFW